MLPFIGLLLRVPWSAMFQLLTDDDVAQSLQVSLIVSSTATLACVVMGLPLALVLASERLRFRRFARAMVMLPMVLPPVSAGTALLFALGRKSLIGGWLNSWFGIQLPFTTSGATVAATFVAMPFFVITVETALRQTGNTLNEAAATLGAGPWATLARVSLPSIRPAIVSAVSLAWARAIGEFGATITFAGNFPGKTRTLPIQTYLAMENNPEAAVAISVLLMTISIAILVVLRDRWMPLRDRWVP